MVKDSKATSMTVNFPKVRPRLRRSYECQSDAQLAKSSPRTGLSCAFDAVYLCFVELAESRGFDVAKMEHPSDLLISLSSETLGLTGGDVEFVRQLGCWCRHGSVLDAAPCSFERAVAVAQMIYQRTSALLDAEDKRRGSPCQKVSVGFQPRG